MNNCIIYCVDENIVQTKFCIHSIYTLLKTTNLLKYNIKIFVISTVKNQLLQTLKDKYNLKFDIIHLENNPDMNQIMLMFHEDNKNVITNMTFCRLALPFCNQLKQFEKILYIDNDTAVYKDISDIFNYESNKFFKMCKTTVAGELLKKYGSINDKYWYISQILSKLFKIPDKKYEHNKIALLNTYYNAGVMLFNNSNIQNDFEKYKQRLMDGIEKYNMYNFTLKDQDLLNFFFYDNIDELNYIYNCQINIAPFRTCAEICWNNAAIIHYFGQYKPELQELVDRFYSSK